MTDEDSEAAPAEEAGRGVPCPVVGIGASAGGLEALQALFDHMPADCGLAFVVVVHIPADSESHLADILQHHTKMPVATVRSRTPLNPDHVYVLNAGTRVEMEAGELVPTPRAQGNGRRTPADHLFASLAREAGEHAVAVLLSGTGSDGTIGMRHVRDAGGLCLAQSPESADHSGMIDSAIASGVVDEVLDVDAMPGALIDWVGRKQRDAAEAGADMVRDDVIDALPAIVRTLRQHSGEDFSNYKRPTLARRLQRRMTALRIDSPRAYEERLREDHEEARQLLSDLLIGVTEFFRDPEAFAALRDVAVPEIFAGKGPEDEVRAWVAGCATGEEAYSVAMLLLDHARRLDRPPKVTVFASDIDVKAIDRARRGLYSASALEHADGELVKRWFHPLDGSGQFKARDQLREPILFAHHNVLRDPPFSRLNLVSCRNLLIYLESNIQARVIQLFRHVLREDGWLFLGASEGVGREAGRFRQVGDRHGRLYRPRPGAPSEPPDFPLMPQEARHAGARPRAGREVPFTPVERLVLDRFAPAWVVVDSDLKVRRFSGRTGKFLEAIAGSPSNDALEMAKAELRAPLRTALVRAFRVRERVVMRDLAVDVDGAEQPVDILVEPIPGGEKDDRQCLVVFEETGPLRLNGGRQHRSDGEEQQRHRAEADEKTDIDSGVRELREQLRTTTEELQTSNEALKSSNEELASMNEELQSSNEELETSKEELQSSNEELQTVNAELQARIEQLARLNNDLRNLFENTAVATLFVDNDLNIRNYTPMLAEVFHVRETDMGRPLRHIAHRLADDQVLDDMRSVISDLQRIEREVRTKDGETVYMLRIKPYYTLDSRIDGAVVTFVDISALKLHEARLKRSRRHERLLQRELQHRVKNILANVRALASHTYNESEDLDAFHEAFEGRIAALARTQNLISATEAQYVNLEDAIREELLAHAVDTEDKVNIAGPELRFEPRAAQTMALAIHELATNAVKYGALAADEGRIDIGWRVEDRDSAKHMVMQWRESGLDLEQNTHRPTGFGRRLIEELTPYELDGSSRLEFPREGCLCTIDIPFEKNIRADDDSSRGREGKPT
ncbi:MAG: chemotaxis protein CheB [Acetobacterales bacterium]